MPTYRMDTSFFEEHDIPINEEEFTRGPKKPAPPLRTGLLAALVGAALAFWWLKTPAPLVGGGQDDGILATWVRNRAYASIPPDEDRRFSRLTAENANGWYGISREPLQTFDNYRQNDPPRPTKERRTLVLQPIGPMNRRDFQLLGDLKSYCEAFFQLPVRVEAPLSLNFVGQSWRKQVPTRQNVVAGDRQYDAGKIIEKILRPRLPRDAVAYLGVTMADIYVDGLSFNFGLANVNDRIGVYSLARYRAEFWHAKPTIDEKARVLRRSCLILSHETGHMLGLTHCVFYKCAMNGANSLSDADDTPLTFCPICRRKLEWNLNCVATKRAADVTRFYGDQGLEKVETRDIFSGNRRRNLSDRPFNMPNGDAYGAGS